jgi:hypothetical protein
MRPKFCNTIVILPTLTYRVRHPLLGNCLVMFTIIMGSWCVRQQTRILL